MRATPLATRLATALAAATLTACGGTVDFTIEKDLVVDTSLPAGALLQPVDLAAEAGGAWKHRDKIDKVTVTSAEAMVTAVSPANVAATVSGDVWLLPEGVTTPNPALGAVMVGSYADEPVQVGNVIGLQLTPELNAFVRNAFNGSGRFSVYASGTNAGGERVACTLHVTLGARLKWTVF